MKKITSLVLVIATILTLIFATGITASAVGTAPTVRVDCIKVGFPDAQPFVDGNCRTLIPVRFVTEALGAKVSWEQNTATAVIEKDGITVRVPIGNDTISVTKDGKTTTTKMDTAAVAKQERTYVPIRFVAEALGAFVDYSNAYNTVQIFNCGKLSKEFTGGLRSLPLTIDEGFTLTPENDEIFKTFEDESYGFANAHEYWIRIGEKNTTRQLTKYFVAKMNSATYIGEQAQIAKYLVEDAEARYSLEYDEVRSKLFSNTALVYMESGGCVTQATVRGFLLLNIHYDIEKGTHASAAFKKDFGLEEVKAGEYKMPFDVHYEVMSSGPKTIWRAARVSYPS